MKKTLAVVAVLAMLTGGALYAKQGKGNDKMGPQHKEGKPEMGQGHKMHKEGQMFIKMAGLESIVEKYQIKIQRLHLDQKEANLNLHEQKRQLHKEIMDLSANYDADPAKNGKEIADRLKKITTIEKSLTASRQKMMDQVQKLRAEEQKEIEVGVDKWISTLSANPAEMKKFADHAKMMQTHMQGMGECPHGKAPKGPKGPK